MTREIALSFCTYNNGTFDVMVKDVATGQEVTFSGEQKLSPEEFALVDDIAPACVWTRYVRKTPKDIT